jgi:hypothetical protein
VPRLPAYSRAGRGQNAPPRTAGRGHISVVRVEALPTNTLGARQPRKQGALSTSQTVSPGRADLGARRR